jgi:hypothetical protein
MLYGSWSEGWIMGTPTEFLQNAQECVELASKTHNAVHRKMLLGVAVKWLQLAGATRHEIELIRNADKQSAA